jgi:hypothetical protein
MTICEKILQLLTQKNKKKVGKSTINNLIFISIIQKWVDDRCYIWYARVQ